MLGLPRNEGGGSYGYIIRKISSNIKKTISRHQLASWIQGIESRVKEVSDGQKRYHSMVMKITSGQGSIATTKTNTRDALSVKEVEPVEELIQRLVEDDNLQFKVISFVEMTDDLHETVKKDYLTDRVKNHFQICASINVSQPFNLKNLLGDLHRQLSGRAGTSYLREMGRIKLIDTVRNILQKYRYVIVLRNVSKIEHWDAMKYAFPHNSCGSRVILTTFFEDVARGASRGSKGEVHMETGLSLEASTTLFCIKTFHENICPGDHLKDIVEHILTRCKGDPLAIEAISGLLSTKSRSRDEWEMVKNRLDYGSEGNYMWKILSLSYYDLPYYLKPCFLYLSAFPEGRVIKCKTLVQLWVGEGFVEPKVGKTLEEVGISYLNQLINRSLIEVVKTDNLNGIARECRIHYLIRDLIIRMSEEQNFMTVVGGASKAWPENTRRLSIMKTMGDVKEIKGLRQLRSLFMMESYFGIPKGVNLLRVLRLEGIGLFEFPEEICNLYHLRYLSLRDNGELRVMPNSIGRLVYLEVLDFRQTRIHLLPATIVKLGRLRHLLGKNDFVGFGAIAGIGSLQALQTLYHVDLLKGKEGIVKEFGKLKQLRKLRIHNLREIEGPDFWSSIENLDQLRNLYVGSVYRGKEILYLQHVSSPPKYLEHLSLWGRILNEPKWICSLHSLTKLYLRDTQLHEDQFVCLQSLPKLLSLKLWQNAYVGETLCFKAASFKKLRFLSLSCLLNLRRVIIEEDAMSSLEELSFQTCYKLEKVPFGIEKLTNLNSLSVRGVSNDFINSIDRSKGGEDYSKVHNIPTIRIWHAAGWKELQKERE